MGGDRSGQAAVAKAVAEQALTASEQAAAPSSAEVTQALQQVGDRTFLLSNGVWVDTTFDATQMTAEAWLSAASATLPSWPRTPRLGRYLALGDRVTVMRMARRTRSRRMRSNWAPALHPPHPCGGPGHVSSDAG